MPLATPCRARVPRKGFIDAVIDVPIVPPPLVVGLSLLILFQTVPGRAIERVLPVTYAIPAVIWQLWRPVFCRASCASPSTRSHAPRVGGSLAPVAGTWRVVLPRRGGMVTARRLLSARWASSPILTFAGATRMKTEVLSTTISGTERRELRGCCGVALMVQVAVLVLVILVAGQGG